MSTLLRLVNLSPAQRHALGGAIRSVATTPMQKVMVQNLAHSFGKLLKWTNDKPTELSPLDIAAALALVQQMATDCIQANNRVEAGKGLPRDLNPGQGAAREAFLDGAIEVTVILCEQLAELATKYGQDLFLKRQADEARPNPILKLVDSQGERIAEAKD